MKTSMFILIFSMSLSLLAANSKEVNYLELMDNSIYIEYANMRMEQLKNDKVMKYYDMKFYRLGDKMRMEFTAPATEKGRKMLNDNSSLWMYLPRTSKVMKLPFKQSFMGSDASNTDLMRMEFQKDYTVVNIVKKENAIIELDLKARNLEVAYDKVKVLFDSKKEIPIRQEMYSLSNKLIKTISYEDIVLVDGNYFPSTVIINDELKKGSLTKLYYTNIKRKESKPSEYFTLGSLKK